MNIRNNRIYFIIGMMLISIMINLGFNKKVIATNNEKTIDEGIYIVRSALDESYVLDISEASQKNNGNLQLWKDDNVPQQRFKLEYLGNGYYSITNVNSDKVLDVANAGKLSGTNVQQFESNNTDAQKWTIKDIGDGYYSIVSKCNGLYLDVSGGTTKNGSNIQVFQGNNTKAQKFKLEVYELFGKKTIENGVYEIKTAIDESYVLDISEASKKNNANLQLWKSVDAPQQRFKIEYIDNGYYTLTNVNSEKVLDVENAGKINGTNVQQFEYNNTNAQKWIIKDLGDGYYSIISKCNGLYLDITGGKCNNGSNIQLFQSNNTKAQKFLIKEYSEITNENTANNTENNTSNNNNNNNNDNIDNGIGENIIEKSEQTIEDGKYIIKTLVNKNFALDITGASTYDRANVQLWSDVSVLQQRFEVEYLPDGYYKITNIKSGKVLDVQDANTKIGANLQQFMWHDVDAQKWIIEKTDDGYYSIKSKLSGLYIDLYNGVALNGQNIHLFSKNNTNAQKFEFERTGTQTIQNGLYTIHTTVNNGFVVDVSGASQENRANVQVWESNGTDAQKFKFIYNERGYYTIKAKHSNKVLDVADGSFNIGTNVHQYEENKTDAQKWIIEKNNDNYSFISKLNGLYFDIYNGVALNGQNIHLFTQNGTNAQLFKLEKTSSVPNLDTSRYPGYLERINNTIDEFSGWEIEFVYTGLNYWDAVNGEYSLRKRNLVPKSYGAYSPWVADDDKTLYDTGWYPASREAIAYQMDPRNFLDSTNIFQFLYVNQFCEDAVSINGISDRVSGKFLQGYEYDIYNACKNTNVDPYYVIARLIQEGGGSTLRMERSEGTYYNPFNIGASGDGTWNVINNAYNTARNNGWDTMQKAIEGGIQFLKNNYLECYQNTLYTNKFDIDRRSGGLYTHQYMQNLFAAYNEARNLCSYYRADNKLDSNFKFIIPLYEEMPSNPTPNPNGVNLSDTICNYTAYIKTRDGDGCYIRSGPGTSYSAIGGYPDGTSLTVIDNKTYLNTNGYDWFRVVLNNGTQGYIPSKFLS